MPKQVRHDVHFLILEHFKASEKIFGIVTLHMNIDELNKSKTPVVIIDNSLEEYKNIPLFQDKVEKANDMLRTVGLPKRTKKKHHA